MTLQEAKDVLQSVGREEIKDILDKELEKQLLEALETIEKFINSELADQKEQLNNYAVRSENANNNCEEILETMNLLKEACEELQKSAEENVQASSTASQQAETSASTSQQASTTAQESAQTAQDANNNIKNLVAQFEEQHKELIENAEHLHNDAIAVTDVLEKAQEILPIIQEFLALSPEFEEMKTTIDNIKNEILPDLRRIQQVLIDTLDSFNEIYIDLKESVIPRANDLYTKLSILNEEIKDADISQALIDLGRIESYKEQIAELMSQLNDLIVNAESLKNTLIETIEEKKDESLAEMEAHKLLAREEFTNNAEATLSAFNDISDSRTADFTELAEDKETSIEKLTTEFTELAENKTREFLNLIYPIGYQYVQYPTDDDGGFIPNETPSELFGGVWNLLFSNESLFFRTGGLYANRDRYNGIQNDAMAHLLINNIWMDSEIVNKISSAPIISTGLRLDIGIESSPSDHREMQEFKFDSDYGPNPSQENRPTNKLMKIWQRIA